MTENWIAFARLMDDNAPAVIGVDLQFAESAPDEERPRALRVALGFLSTNDNGLPRGEEEYEALERIEDRVLEEAGRSGAVFVGRRSYQGSRDLYFYTPQGDAAAAAVAGVLRDITDRPTEADTVDDPQWEFYLEQLLPDEAELRRVMDEAVVEQLEEAGDPLSVPRPVTHFVYFADAAARDAFAARAAEQGFRPEAFEDEDPDDEDERFGLSLEREDAVELEAINEVTTDLALAAEEAGGRYDGWETEIVRGEQ